MHILYAAMVTTLSQSGVCNQDSLHGIDTIPPTHLHIAPSSSQTPASLNALHFSSLYPPIPLLSSCSIVSFPRLLPVPNAIHIQHDIIMASLTI